MPPEVAVVKGNTYRGVIQKLLPLGAKQIFK
jgi:hypothetical protein